MCPIKNKVILWGIDDVNTLGVVREFGEAGLDFTFLVRGKLKFASKSKYVKNLVPIASHEDGLKYIVANYSDEENKPIIISTGDGVSVFIDLNRDELEKYCILPTTKNKGDVEKYTDKYTMTQLAENCGLLCPKSKLVVWNTPVDEIEYPCLIKPSHMKPGHRNEFKYKMCKDESELKDTLANVHHESVFILQEFIKSENDLVIYGVRLNDGKTLYAGSILGDHRACGICSHGFISKNIPSSIDLTKLNEFLNRLDYKGPFGFDFGIVGNQAFFYEINLRNDGTCHCFYQAGAKLLLAYIYDCAGVDYSNLSLVPNDVWFIDEIHDFQNVIEGKVSFKDWRKAHHEAEINRFYNKEDLAPWRYVKRRKWIEIFKYIILGKYRLQVVTICEKLGIKL